MLWTLLIFILCLLPAKDIPDVQVPLIDKWVHFVLFGVFALLWLLAYPGRKPGFSVIIFLVSVATGWLVEELQGMLPTLGRTKDVMDAVADGIGGLLGVVAYQVAQLISSGAGKQAG